MKAKQESEKQPYSLTVEPEHEQKIRKFMRDKKEKTGVSIQRIHTEMLLKQIDVEG